MSDDVIGGASLGEHTAGALAEGGLRVALVERELVGDECSYWACVPSKRPLRPGEAAAGAAVLRDTIQPFPTFSEIYMAALEALHAEMTTAREGVGAASP